MQLKSDFFQGGSGPQYSLPDLKPWGKLCSSQEHWVPSSQVAAASVAGYPSGKEDCDCNEAYRCLIASIYKGYCIVELIFDQAGRPVHFRLLADNPGLPKEFDKLTGVAAKAGDLGLTHDKRWLAMLSRVSQGGEPVHMACDFANEEHHFDLFAFPIGAPDARQVAVVFTDITRRVESEADRDFLEHVLEARIDELKATIKAMLAKELVDSGPDSPKP